jgi:hypothetical protein
MTAPTIRIATASPFRMYGYCPPTTLEDDHVRARRQLGFREEVAQEPLVGEVLAGGQRRQFDQAMSSSTLGCPSVSATAYCSPRSWRSRASATLIRPTSVRVSGDHPSQYTTSMGTDFSR